MWIKTQVKVKYKNEKLQTGSGARTIDQKIVDRADDKSD